MTNAKRKQLLALDVVLGFSGELAKHPQASQRTVPQAVRLEHLTRRMIERIGPSKSATASNDILRRFEAVKQALRDQAQDEVCILTYCNALLFLTEVATRHMSGTRQHGEWEYLFDAVQTVYETMDPDLAETEAMRDGTALGVRLWEAIVSASVATYIPATMSIHYAVDGIHPEIKHQPTDVVGQIVRQQLAASR